MPTPTNPVVEAADVPLAAATSSVPLDPDEERLRKFTRRIELKAQQKERNTMKAKLISVPSASAASSVRQDPDEDEERIRKFTRKVELEAQQKERNTKKTKVISLPPPKKTITKRRPGTGSTSSNAESGYSTSASGGTGCPAPPELLNGLRRGHLMKKISRMTGRR